MAMWDSISPPDHDDLKFHQMTTWTAGNFGRISVRFQMISESLCEAVDLCPCDNVLDVASGNGNAALAAARRFADVTATDYVPELLSDAQRRAEAEGLTLLTRFADAECLPFEDGEFDVALSTFGVMYVPDAERAASELARVVRPGGRIGLTSWTSEGLVGQLKRAAARFLPTRESIPPLSNWGSESRLHELFGDHAASIRTTRKEFVFRYLSMDHWLDVFRNHYGPMREAFAAVHPDQHGDLREALFEQLARFDRGRHSCLSAPAEYLEVVIERA
jgi:ubiquinone/menaquinone biosynthesis C-methylase UbiE